MFQRPLVLAGALLFCLIATGHPGGARASIDDVLASVNQSVVTRRDTLLYATDLRIRDGQLWGVPLEELEREIVPEMIEELVLYYHFFRVTEQLPEEELGKQVEDAWGHYIRLVGSPDRLRTVLAGEGLRPDEMRAWLKQRARRREVINRGLVMGIDPSLLNRSDDSPATAERFLLAEVFVRPLINSDEGWQEAAERAARVRLRVSEGVPFEQVAALFSDDDVSARDGGQLGWVDTEALNPSVREALVAISPGGVTAPIRGEQGFHVLQMMDYETEARRNAWEAYLATRDRVLAQARDEVEVLTRSSWMGFEDSDGLDRAFWEPEAISTPAN